MRRTLCLLSALVVFACNDDSDSARVPEGTVELKNGPLSETTDEDTSVVFFAARTPTVTLTPTHGTTEVDGTTVQYTPVKDYNGNDSFNVAFSNGSTNSVAAITVTITPVNDAPVASDVDYGVGTTTLVVDVAQGLVHQASDIDSAALSATVVAQPMHGTVTVDADGGFTYTQAEIQADSFTYAVQDDAGAVSNTATVTLILVPTAIDDNYNATYGTTLVVNAQNGVLANDSGAAGADLGASLLQGTEHGSLSLGGDGSFRYSASTGAFDTDTFSYQATQADGEFATANVTIAIAY